MASSLTILAQDDSGAQLFYVIAVLILAGVGAIFEKVKQKSAEGERRQRSRPRAEGRPRVPPPVEPRGGTDFPPPVARPPRSAPERAAPPPVRRPMERPAAPKPPRRRPPAVPEARRLPETRVPASTAPLVTATEQAASESERQIESMFQGGSGSLQPVESLAQIRSRRREQATPTADTAGFGKPTVADLRRAIVLNEILGQPLGLRERVEF